jgi:hypothetical protein
MRFDKPRAALTFVVVFVVVVLVGATVILTRSKQYQSQSVLLVTTGGYLTPPQLPYLQTPPVATQANLATNANVATRTSGILRNALAKGKNPPAGITTDLKRLQQSHVSFSTDRIKREVSVTASQGPSILTINATAPNGAEAEAVAWAYALATQSQAQHNALAEILRALNYYTIQITSKSCATAGANACQNDTALVGQLRKLEFGSFGGLEVANPYTAAAAAGPSVTAELAALLLAALVAGLAGGVLSTLTGLNGARSAAARAGLPVLGALPEGRPPSSGPAGAVAPGPAAQLAALRLESAVPPNPCAVIVLVGAVSARRACSLLGHALVERRHSVVVISDPPKRAAKGKADSPPASIAAVLDGASRLQDAFGEDGSPTREDHRLTALTLGAREGVAIDLLSKGELLGELIRVLRERASFIIIDCTARRSDADIAAFARLADGAVAVAQGSRRSLASALERLAFASEWCPPHGVLFVDVSGKEAGRREREASQSPYDAPPQPIAGPAPER